MDHAIIVAAGTGVEDTDLSIYGGIKFGSLPQIKRLVINAQRTGIRHFTIITKESDSPLKDILASDKRIDSTISWVAEQEKIVFKNIPYLIIQSNLLTTPKALSNFIEEEIDEDNVYILSETSDDPWIKTDEDRISEITPNGGKVVGAFIASGQLLNHYFSDTATLYNMIPELITEGKARSHLRAIMIHREEAKTIFCSLLA